MYRWFIIRIYWLTGLHVLIDHYAYTGVNWDIAIDFNIDRTIKRTRKKAKMRKDDDTLIGTVPTLVQPKLDLFFRALWTPNKNLTIKSWWELSMPTTISVSMKSDFHRVNNWSSYKAYMIQDPITYAPKNIPCFAVITVLTLLKKTKYLSWFSADSPL